MPCPITDSIRSNFITGHCVVCLLAEKLSENGDKMERKSSNTVRYGTVRCIALHYIVRHVTGVDVVATRSRSRVHCRCIANTNANANVQ